MVEKKKNLKPKQSRESLWWPQEVVLDIYGYAVYPYTVCIHPYILQKNTNEYTFAQRRFYETKLYFWGEICSQIDDWLLRSSVPQWSWLHVVVTQSSTHTLTIYTPNTTWHLFTARQITSLRWSFLFNSEKVIHSANTVKMVGELLSFCCFILWLAFIHPSL